MLVEDSGQDSTKGDQGVLRDEKGRLVAGSGSLNPAGRPRGRNWSATLADLAETKIRGGGGKTKAEAILNKLIDQAMDGDLQATSLILDRLEGKAVARVVSDITSNGEGLNAQISFVSPMKEIDVTPEKPKLGEGGDKVD